MYALKLLRSVSQVKLTPGLNILEWQAYDIGSESEKRDSGSASRPVPSSGPGGRIFDRMPVRLRFIEISGAHPHRPAASALHSLTYVPSSRSREHTEYTEHTCSRHIKVL